MKKNIGIDSGVIWITGFSASGKTTVSRKICHDLLSLRVNVIHLDGDELRSIFGDQWGFDKKSRIELAHVYMRLCSHLASQGYVVVLSAVAMFDSVIDWAMENISNVVQVYLDVPRDKRIERDKKTKNIYNNSMFSDDYYDIPQNASLTIKNYDVIDAVVASQKIIKHFMNSTNLSDKGRTKHWDKFYKDLNISEESPFSIFVNSKLGINQSILEIGCGNGRDSQFFAKNNHKVVGIDRSSEAIKNCLTNFSHLDIEFLTGTIDDILAIEKRTFNAIYSRFVIHAMPLEEEIQLLDKSYELLADNGMLFIECRSVNDKMFMAGEVLSSTERIHGHYRRFIVLDDFQERLEVAGFTILYKVEGNGLAIHKHEDPTVIRIIAQKSG